jgi:extradiol dioxygenase family protein
MSAARRTIFHLAIPCRDLDEAADFYARLGCRIARRYPDRVTMDFFGDQVVCHLAPDETDREPRLYPRHFGLTFFDAAAFGAFVERCRALPVRFFAEPFTRFPGMREEHASFVILDPSNNLIECKCYIDPAMAY